MKVATLSGLLLITANKRGGMVQQLSTTRIVVLAIGLLYGAWQMIHALRSIFVFTDSDAHSVGTWVVVTCGFLLTMPLFLLSLLKPRVAAWSLISSTAVAVLAMPFSLPSVKYLLPLAVVMIVPNVILGILLLRTARQGPPMRTTA
jgi:hypothetical protein